MVELDRDTDDAGATLDAVLHAGTDVVVVVDDADELDDADTRRLEQLAGVAEVRLVAAVDTASAARAFSGLVPALKRGRRILVLQPESSAEVDQLAGVRMRFRPGAVFPPGRGVLAIDRQPHVVQIAGDA